MGSTFSNPASFRVCLWALTLWVVRFLTLPPFECALEPSTTLGSVFSNLTSVWVRLRALTSQIVRFLTLPPFECALQPYPSGPISFQTLLWAPISWIVCLRALSCHLFKTFHFFYLGRLSDLFENSFHLPFRPVAHYNEAILRNLRISHHLQNLPSGLVAHYNETILRNLLISHHFEKSLYFSPFWKIFVFFTTLKNLCNLQNLSSGQVAHYNKTTLKNLCIFHHFEKSPYFSPLWKIFSFFTRIGHPLQ